MANSEAGIAVERFEYPVCTDGSSLPAWNGWVEVDTDTVAEAANGAEQTDQSDSDASLAERLAEEARRAFEAGRERGREEGRRAELDAQARNALQEAELRRKQAAELLERAAREREHYFHAAEQEVVRLALAVAARILRREAQMDPLLLTGAVRVALGQLAGTTEISLRVPAREAQLWREAMALLPNHAVKPVVVADDGLLLGDCVIESRIGTVDLGIRTQLGEIERGFFDRGASRNPAVSLPADDSSAPASHDEARA